MRTLAAMGLLLVSCGGGGGGGSKDVGATFNRAAGFDRAPSALAVDEYDRLWVGGRFDAFTDTPVANLARFGGSGGQIDTSFDLGSGPNGSVQAIRAVANGSGAAWIGGSFTEVDGAPRRGLALIENVGALDPFFQPGTGFLGSVRALALADDGSGDVWAGGIFSAYDGTPTVNLARVRPDGTLAAGTSGTGFGVDSAVFALAPVGDGSGDVYVGGRFLEYDGTPLGSIVRIRNGAIEPSFATGSGFALSSGSNFQTVRALALAEDGSGDVLVGGLFDSYDGTGTPNLARLTNDGTLVTAFSAGGAPNGSVEALLPVGDGSGDVFVGGSFENIAGQVGPGLARIRPDGSQEPSFDMGANRILGTVSALAPVPGTPGAVSAAGGFTTAGTPAYPHLVRLQPDGTVHPSSVPSGGLQGLVLDVLPRPDGSAVVTGTFSSYAGSAVSNLVRLGADGGLQIEYPQVAGAGFRLSSDALSAERFYVVGSFVQVGSHSTKHAARMELAGGPPDTSFQIFDLPGFGPNGAITDAIPMPDGALLVNGNYTQWDGFASRNLVKLDAAGQDYSNSAFADGEVYDYAIAEDGSGRVWAGGTFTMYFDVFTPAPRVGLLRPVAVNFYEVDADFAPGKGFDGGVPRALVVRPQTAEVYVGGDFAEFDGQPASRILRLLPDGNLDPTFATGAGFDAVVHNLAVAADGTGDIYVSGEFTSYDGVAVSNFVRLKSTGALDPTFANTTGFNGAVRRIAPVGGGSREIYVCGDFTTYDGVTTGSVVRLNADGSAD